MESRTNWFEAITDRLRDYPDGYIWCSGPEILCITESAAHCLADLFETLYHTQGDDVTVVTGYYDPAEDKKDNIEDQYTGWWYVHLD